jgi:hypothetical protein
MANEGEGTGVPAEGAGEGTGAVIPDAGGDIDFLSEVGQSTGETVVKAAKEDDKAAPKKADDKKPDEKAADGTPKGDEPPASDEEEPPLDEKDAEIARLKEENEKLKAVPAKGEEPEEPEVPAVTPEQLAVDFIADDKEFDDAFEKKEAMNKVLQKVMAKSIETVLVAMPKVIDKVVRNQVLVYAKSIEFWNRNKDLKEHAKFVGEVINDMIGKDPSLKLDDLFGTDGKPGKLDTEARARLASKGKAKQKEVKKEEQRERPAFVKGAGARVPVAKVPDMTPLEADIKDLIE